MTASELSQIAIKAAKDCRRDADDAAAATTIANAFGPVVHENGRLREAVCLTVEALDNGSRLSPDASLNFLCEVPGEVELCVRRLRHSLDTAARLVIDKPKTSGPDMERLEKELAVAREELFKWRIGGVDEAMLRKHDGHIRVGNCCEITMFGASQRLSRWEVQFPLGQNDTAEKLRLLESRNAELIAAMQQIAGRAAPMASDLGDAEIFRIATEALSTPR